MIASASMTSSARATSLVPNPRVALSMATVTSSAISTRRPCTSSRDWWKTSRIPTHLSWFRGRGSRPRPADHRQGRLTDGAPAVNSTGLMPPPSRSRRIAPRACLYAGRMDTTQLALLALLAGIIIGGSISAVVVAAMRARDRAHAEGSIEIPDGVRGVLHGMDDAAVVVDASFTVLAASSPATAFELLEGGTLPTDELRTLARRVRTTDAEVTEASATETMRLRRGAPPAEPRLVAVRASRISPRLTLLVLRDISERERVAEM